MLIFLFTTRRTPNKILKTVFKIEIKNGYKVLETKEQWDLNGDGYYYCKIANVTFLDISKIDFKKDLIIKNLPPNSINKNEFKEKLYYLEFDENDERNFKLLLYNSNKNELVVYYQIL